MAKMDNDRQEQFARAFLQYQDRVYAHIVLMLPNRHDAEDVFQQTSLVLWKKWEEFDRGGDFLCWACGIAHNEVRNFLRHRGRDRMVLSDKLLNNLADVRLREQPLLDRRQSLLADCIKRLDFAAREMLERCYAAGSSMKAVARQFRTTPNALYLRLRRIRRELMECIEQQAGKEDAGR
jgi:RNA polymerase sigma-70 factor (ECF subfamily)